MNKKSTSYIMPTYGERDLVFSKGKGCYLYTPSGIKYLDFAGGIAVNSLGHCHPKLVNVLKKQSDFEKNSFKVFLKGNSQRQRAPAGHYM